MRTLNLMLIAPKYLIFFVWVLIFMPIGAKAQDPLLDLRVTGNFVEFNYSALEHFNNGISLNSWSRVRIRFKDSGSTGWELRMWALSSAIHYEGDSSNDIDLVDLEIIPSITSTTDGTAAVNNGFVLEEGPLNELNIDQVLAYGDGGTVGGDPPIEVELVITYNLGQMTNKPEGLYFVNLNLRLIETN
ncbi:MAG: hypothetical protein ACLFNU_12185 [Bacteroidales bacterium]